MDKINEITKLINDIKSLKDVNNNIDCKEQIKSLESQLFKLSDKGKTVEDVFVNALRYKDNDTKLTQADNLIYNYLSEDEDETGNLIVPNDIMTEVRNLRLDGTDLESLVNVEPVTTNKGKRTFEIRADIDPLPEVADGADIPEIDVSKLKEVAYKIARRAGIINVASSLLEDSNSTVLNWLKKWIAKKSKATRNYMIIQSINSMTAGKEIPATDLKLLRTAAFTSLIDAYKDNAIALTNYSGYEYLDGLVDTSGNKILESDPTQSKTKLLFGLYPVKKVPDALLASGTGTIPIVLGDLKEAITIFDRQKASIDMAPLFAKPLVLFRLIERLDIKPVDTDALIKINLTKV